MHLIIHLLINGGNPPRNLAVPPVLTHPHWHPIITWLTGRR